MTHAETIRQDIIRRLRRVGDPDFVKSHRLEWHGMLVVYYPTSNTFNWFPPGSPRNITKGMRKQAVLDYITAHLEGRP